MREGVVLHVFVCESVFNRHYAAASVPEHVCGRERAGGLARERERERRVSSTCMWEKRDRDLYQI